MAAHLRTNRKNEGDGRERERKTSRGREDDWSNGGDKRGSREKMRRGGRLEDWWEQKGERRDEEGGKTGGMEGTRERERERKE